MQSVIMTNIHNVLVNVKDYEHIDDKNTESLHLLLVSLLPIHLLLVITPIYVSTYIQFLLP